MGFEPTTSSLGSLVTPPRREAKRFCTGNTLRPTGAICKALQGRANGGEGKRYTGGKTVQNGTAGKGICAGRRQGRRGPEPARPSPGQGSRFLRTPRSAVSPSPATGDLLFCA